MPNTSINSTCFEQSHWTVQKLNEDLLWDVLPVTIFIGLEAAIGFIGNILILCVYAKWYINCNFRYFVLCLAIYDLTSCLTTLPGEIFSQLFWYDYQYGWVCKIKSYFNVFTAWGSAFTLLLLAFDRYRKICRPLAWQIQPSFAWKLCLSGIFLASFVSIPITILWGQQTYPYTINGMTLNVSICEKSGDYANGVYPFIYISCVYILPIGLMMAAICVCNVLIARKLFCKIFSPGVASEIRGASSTMRRNVSTSSDISRLSSVSLGIRKILCYTTSLISVENFTVSETRISSRRRSFVSLSAISLREVSEGRSSSSTTCLTDNQVTTQTTSFSGCNFGIPTMSDTTSSTNQTPTGGTIQTSCEDTTTSADQTTNGGGTIQTARDVRSEVSVFRRKRKTLIMLILTSVFVVTMTLYIALLSLVAEKNNILKRICNTEKVVFFFFWRIYFINCIVNPILYGVMDPRFRTGLKRLFRCCVFKA